MINHQYVFWLCSCLEYRDNSDLIPRNASVIVARRIRGIVDTLTPLSTQKPVVSSDDIVKEWDYWEIFK